MGQFKPMVKMMTTEPTVELKLKKGGSVNKADGGYVPMQSGMASTMPSPMPSRGGMMPARGGMMPSGRPAKPSMAMRRKAMMASKPPMSATPAMKEGGESKATHKAEMTKMKGLEKELKSHEGKPASKAHKGLKTGGVVMGQAGFKAGGIISNEGQAATSTKMVTTKPNHSPAKTGDVKMGNGGGYKMGGATRKYAKGGSVMNYVEGNVVGTPAGKTNTTTGDVAKSIGGGYKKGGALKKYARGGEVVQDNGKAVEMPQGRKKPSAPVSITALSGTFKKGGRVKKMAGGGSESDYDAVIDREMSRRDAEKASERADNESMRDSILGAPGRLLEGAKRLFNKAPPSGSVTKTEKSVTVSPKKAGGSVMC
jgi:hypothetical protein